ncbi:uncharacterized protein F5147DRAFT_748791 [Suillus discolor]|uniref:Uncharacterized protein n=1 Tax=Suillus discolor TaxID=1912936 RepID=A0A9P7ES24_9AGAM|nr:uncharacterized protein F5147DRAFT_748791 [Suillus discolor]KAG2084602.1 hypothetical protein F5147DRAFT_748791 [Suillus discolor]
MVKTCLKVGMPKDNILNIINAVQNPPPDEKREQDQEYDVDDGGHKWDAIGEFSNAWGVDSSAPEPGTSTQTHPSMLRPSTSTLGGATPDRPAASVSTSVQPQPQPRAQAQAPPQPGPSVLYAYPGQSAPPPPVSQPHTPTYGYGETSEVAILEPSQKRTRHCCKGGHDCGKIDCKGRNSRRPDKVYSEAWN